SFTWGNHDASWMGACLGHPALIATVLRISLRYRRLSQLEEGYGVIVAPLEKLARTVYGDDPAECFKTKGTGLRDDLLMARMQKAAAIIQFKLEGQLIRRRPEWQMEHRNLLHRINLENGTVEVDGRACAGRELFDALDGVVRRCFRKGAESANEDTDWLWYLWTGPRSPLFGKDRMATFETYFIEDKATHKETKNPYFQLIQNADFCTRLAREFSVEDDALIVN